MSFLTANSADIAAAAAQLEAIISSLAAQNAGAAAPTTAIAPAAADPVSIQQAGIFSAYGAQYQQIAAQAQAMQEQYASTLGLSSGTYASTEASNANATAASSAAQAAQAADPSSTPWDNFIGFLSNSGPFGLSGGPVLESMAQGGNWASAYSDTIGLAGGGLLTALPTEAAAAAGASDLASATAPAGAGAGMVGMGAMPVAAGVGQATMVGKLSVPPSWAGTFTPVASPAAAVQTVGWPGAAPQAGPGTIIPGMPGMGAAARNSAGFGAPRYGVKPIVMPKPTAV